VAGVGPRDQQQAARRLVVTAQLGSVDDGLRLLVELERNHHAGKDHGVVQRQDWKGNSVHEMSNALPTTRIPGLAVTARRRQLAAAMLVAT
jgi:hypothetical protein